MNPTELSKWLLRATLGALAIAAFLGAYGLLLGLGGYEGPAIGTAVGFAIGAGLLLRVMSKLQKPDQRAAAVFAIGLISFQFVFFSFILWGGQVGLFDTEQLWMTKGVLWVVGLSIVACLQVMNRPGGIIAAYTGFVCAVIVFLTGIIAIWIFSDDEKMGLTAAMFFALGLPLVGSMVGHGVDRKHWRWLGTGAALLAIALFLRLIWSEPGPSALPASSAASLAAFIAYTNLILRIQLIDWQPFVRWGSIVALAAGAVLLNFAIAQDEMYWDELPSMRAALAALFLCGCGTIAMQVMARMNRAPVISEHAPRVKHITVLCPLCEGKILTPVSTATTDPAAAAAAPSAKCPTCGVIVRVQVEIPHCKNCGYLLLRLTSGTCPECGTPVGAAGRPSLTANPGCDNFSGRSGGGPMSGVLGSPTQDKECRYDSGRVGAGPG